MTGNSAPCVKNAPENIDEVFYDSDTEVNDTKEVTVQQVQVQIEVASRQAQLPSIASYKSADDSEERVMPRGIYRNVLTLSHLQTHCDASVTDNH